MLPRLETRADVDVDRVYESRPKPLCPRHVTTLQYRPTDLLKLLNSYNMHFTPTCGSLQVATMLGVGSYKQYLDCTRIYPVLLLAETTQLFLTQMRRRQALWSRKLRLNLGHFDDPL